MSKRVQPGDNVEMILKTHHPVAAEPGQRFNIREGVTGLDTLGHVAIGEAQIASLV
jgi:translation elongation factor EF-Tu-like GTPase